MRRIKYIFGLLLTMSLLSSCGKFLKETTGDLLIPTEVKHYDALLYGEGYPGKNYSTLFSWVTLMSDDIEEGLLFGGMAWGPGFDMSRGGDGKYAYGWYRDIEQKITDNLWDALYSRILGCNTVIEDIKELDNIPDQDIGLYNHVLGAAHTLRAYYYFSIVNWYAKPYSKENLKDLGVIIKVLPNVTIETFERSTIEQVYNLIKNDLAIAMDYAKNARSTANKALITKKATQFLINRVALFTEDWDNVIKNGEEFMLENSLILDLNGQDKSTFGVDNSTAFGIFNASNSEIIFKAAVLKSPRTGSYDYLSYLPLFSWGFKTATDSKNALMPLYSDDDLRKKAYYLQDTYQHNNNYPFKYHSDAKETGFMINWRNVEIVLNIAEAYARKNEGVSAEAIEWINRLRIRRIDNATYKELTVADFNSKDKLVQFIWDERRRELSFEETMRWWDMRRQGCNEVEHSYKESDGEPVIYILEKNSPNFVLPIPKSETKININITQNPRVLENIKK